MQMRQNVNNGVSNNSPIQTRKDIKALFTWGEGNPPRRVTLLGGLPSSTVFPGFVYMRGRVTPGGG